VSVSATRRPAAHRPSEATVDPEEAAALVIQVMPKLVRTTIAAMRDTPHTAGMTLAQFKILGRLSEGEHRAGELAEALDVGGATLTVTADTLERRGLIERVRGLPDDRRAVVLRLTPAGQALYREIKARAISGMAELLSASKPSERAALVTGLAALERGLEARCAQHAASVGPACG
jgi:DNA-binding MarR family transcriptional regulator